MVARCNNGEFWFTTVENFEVLLTHFLQMSRTYEVPVYAKPLMANHVHLLLRIPTPNALGRPLRWFMTEIAKAFHRAQGRCGHTWEWRYLACLVEDDADVLGPSAFWIATPGVRAGLGGGL